MNTLKTYKQATTLLRQRHAAAFPRHAVREVSQQLIRANPPDIIVHKTYVSSVTGDVEFALGRLPEHYPQSVVQAIQGEVAAALGPDWTVYEAHGVMYAVLQM